MNAITRPAALPAPDPLAARRAAATARLSELAGAWFHSQHLTLRILPAATPEERIALAAILLAGTGARIAPTTETAS